MRRKPKGYRDQYIECRVNENIIEDKCIHCGHMIIICKKYGKQCKSSNCREERMNDIYQKIIEYWNGRGIVPHPDEVLDIEHEIFTVYGNSFENWKRYTEEERRILELEKH